MDSWKDLIVNIKKIRDINSINLSYRKFDRLSSADKKIFSKMRVNLLRNQNIDNPWFVLDTALWVYTTKYHSRISLEKTFKYVMHYRNRLYREYNQVLFENLGMALTKRMKKYLGKQFLFHGFIPLDNYNKIQLPQSGSSWSYITSLNLNGSIYIYPKRLRMVQHNGRFVWKHFHQVAIPGATRVWDINQIKGLKKLQDDQIRRKKGN